MRLSKNMIKTKLSFWISDNQIDEWFRNRNVFFIFGMGRSGTKFLSDLLSKDRTVFVFHEPVSEDFDEVVDAHKSNKYASKYINGFRKKRMYCIVKSCLKTVPYPAAIRTYGEVNSALRFHVRALKTAFPNAKMLHLVRDGRETVRSIMMRQHYTEDGAGHHSLSPGENDPLSHKWGGLTRFEKVCWLWADANKRISEDVFRFVNFEKLIRDYTYFLNKIEDYLGINVGEKQWHEAIKKRKNKTKNFTIPHWTEWDSVLIQRFNEICGDEMKKYGYF